MSPQDRSGDPALPALALYAAAGLAGAVAAAAFLPPGEAAFATGFWALALAVLRIDLERFLIPDGLVLAIAALGLARAAVTAAPDATAPALGWAMVQGAGAFAVLWAARRLYARFAGREGIGFGDVKLAGALGLWLSPFAQAMTLEIAALAALALVGLAALTGAAPEGRATAVPFGAFLAPAAVVVHLAGLAAPDLFGGLP